MKFSSKLPIILTTIMFSFNAHAFVSGSTGVDGAFNPTANIQLQLPPSGIFNFTDVNIPAGVFVSFIRNANNTPVTMLVSGNATIDGNVILNGGVGGGFNDGSPGIGAPGGFDGGRGGLRVSSGANEGGDGQGPGRGKGGPRTTFGGANAVGASYGSLAPGNSAPIYGNAELLPLIGGSGGGGSSGDQNIAPGGGGGAGAILIAASGTFTINGTILANGGPAGGQAGAGAAGSGSGGAIRIVATTLQGEGTINATRQPIGQDSGDGRIRLEAENLLRTSGTLPAYSFSTPGLVLIANLPALSISSVGGIAAPANPTGNRDVELPGVTTNPVTVEFQTTNVPLGTTVVLTAAAERGISTTANSTPVAGSVNSGTASANINLPNGNSILSAQTTFTVTASLGADFSKYAKGEQVEKVRVGINPEGLSETTFITISGKEFTVPSNAVAMQ
jgi:hypothetical protein